jgi:hypothetical protein
MRSGGVLGVTVTGCALLAVAVAAIAGVTGHISLGVGIAAGLVLGSLNGYLIQALLRRGTPFVAASLMRLVVFSLFALAAAVMMGAAAWTVPMGIGAAQLVMVAAGVRQGLRA